jgi:hypothetical protein
MDLIETRAIIEDALHISGQRSAQLEDLYYKRKFIY